MAKSLSARFVSALLLLPLTSAAAFAQICVTARAGDGFQNTPFTAQTGTFTATFDATPSASPISSTMGLSNGRQTANTGLAAIARFNSAGRIDARNGGAYAAASPIRYLGRQTYHFRMVVNVAAHTYSIFVTPPGSAEQTVGTNFAFRTEQNRVTQLSSQAVAASSGSNTVCNLVIAGGGGGAAFDMTTTPPTPLTVGAGAVVRYTIGVTARNGFSGVVALSATGLPPGATVAFIPASITGSGVSTMEIVTAASSPGGTFTITATGTASGVPPRTTTATLIITGGATPDFSLSASPASRSITAGTATSYTTTLARFNGFAGAVALSLVGLPGGATGTFTPATLSGGTASSTLNISTAATVSAGTFSLTIQGTSGAIVRSTNVTLVVGGGGGGGDACPTCTHKRLKIVNGCGQPMWIMFQTGFQGGVLNAPNRRRLGTLGEFIEYDIPDKGLAGVRFWPGMQCDASGNNCQIGASGGPVSDGFTCPDGIGCAPPIDSKFEGTFGCIAGVSGAECQQNPSANPPAPLLRDDFWDTSMVDGFTLPVRVDVHGSCPPGNPGGPPGNVIDCSNLRFSDCPTGDDLSTNGQFPSLANQNLVRRHPNTNAIVGCYSPSSKLTMGQWQSIPRPPFTGTTFSPPDPQAQFYACPTPPISVDACRQGPVVNTDFVRLIHARCNNTYAYAYDDVNGLSRCPAATNLSYEVTFFCPQ